MALFESYERRIDKINQVLNSYGIASLEEAEKITKDAGLDVYNQIKGIQPICFENACWAYITGAAIAIKKGCRKASDAAAAIGAIGQKLHEGQLYAAHRTLPLPCRVRITNLSNGRSCEARVADRGPFIPGRLIDVSSEVAHELDFHRQGLERVRVEVLSVGDGPWERSL